MPRHYPPKARREACERMFAASRSRTSSTSWESPSTPSQALIDPGQRPGVKSLETDPRAAARRRIQELKAEVEMIKGDQWNFRGGRARPKRKLQIVRGLNNLGYSERAVCLLVGLGRSSS
jgi:hypothetical protein